MSELKKFIVDLELFLNKYQTKVSPVVQDKEVKMEPYIFDLNDVSIGEYNKVKEELSDLKKKYNDLEEQYIFLETSIERGCNSNLEETKNDGRVKHYHMHYSRSLQYIYDTVDREISYRDKIEELFQTNRDLCAELNTVQTALESIYNKLKP
jgi:hypothetical protein